MENRKRDNFMSADGATRQERYGDWALVDQEVTQGLDASAQEAITNRQASEHSHNLSKVGFRTASGSTNMKSALSHPANNIQEQKRAYEARLAQEAEKDRRIQAELAALRKKAKAANNVAPGRPKTGGFLNRLLPGLHK